jgi:hypothetical protein
MLRRRDCIQFVERTLRRPFERLKNLRHPSGTGPSQKLTVVGQRSMLGRPMQGHTSTVSQHSLDRLLPESRKAFRLRFPTRQHLTVGDAFKPAPLRIVLNLQGLRHHLVDCNKCPGVSSRKSCSRWSLAALLDFRLARPPSWVWCIPAQQHWLA